MSCYLLTSIARLDLDALSMPLMEFVSTVPQDLSLLMESVLLRRLSLTLILHAVLDVYNALEINRLVRLVPQVLLSRAMELASAKNTSTCLANALMLLSEPVT